MSQSRPIPGSQKSSTRTSRWMVVIFNNDSNTFEEVISVLMLATGCDIQEAYIETWETHTYGKTAVHFGAREECQEAAEIIARIGVKTEVCLEWDD